MKLPKIMTVVGALLGLSIVAIGGYLVLQPPRDLVPNAAFSTDTITPNADGEADIAIFSYELTDNATVSLSFKNEAGLIFYFRDNNQRDAGTYSVPFSGVVDGYLNPDETIEGEIERRLIPNGRYTWTFTATAEDGETQSHSGTLSVAEGDSELPQILSFDVSSTIFTPNQDGVRDRVRVNVFLAKPSDLKVFLEDQNGAQVFLAERLLGREIGDEGNHEFDYDGGVDDGYEPPADGDYTLYAVAQDAVGQRIVRQRTLTIQDGGLPQAEIGSQSSGGTVCFTTLKWDDKYYTDLTTVGALVEEPEGSCSTLETLTLEEGDLLVFWLTVTNYGRTAIRTQGPFPGAVYDFNQLSNALGYLEQDGVYRIGISCQTATADFPWRWAIGAADNLTVVEDTELDETFYYLEPEQSTTVWGAVRMTEIFEERNPQNCWAGLIHEGVSVDPFQRQVGVREVKIVPLTESQTQNDPDNQPFGG